VRATARPVRHVLRNSSRMRFAQPMQKALLLAQHVAVTLERTKSWPTNAPTNTLPATAGQDMRLVS